MKNILLALILFSSLSLLAQKTKNGIVYKEHPGLSLIETFNDALVSGDFEKAGSLLEDDFKIRNGVGTNKTLRAGQKHNLLKTWNGGITISITSQSKKIYLLIQM